MEKVIEFYVSESFRRKNGRWVPPHCCKSLFLSRSRKRYQPKALVFWPTRLQLTSPAEMGFRPSLWFPDRVRCRIQMFHAAAGPVLAY
jgi:hypothetical protein